MNTDCFLILALMSNVTTNVDVQISEPLHIPITPGSLQVTSCITVTYHQNQETDSGTTHSLSRLHHVYMCMCV